MSSIYLNDFRYNLHSQNGEDGVLNTIFNEIGTKNKWCCEFGAWDGIYLSNTRNLINQGWSSVLIESDYERFKHLTCSQKDNSTAIHAAVEMGGKNTLDNILASTDIPRDFDLLSIDIDGDDLTIWDSLENYQPRVVVLEVDSSIRPLPPGSKQIELTSLEAAVWVAKVNGYELALHLGNAIFVLRQYAEKLQIDPENWRELFDPSWL